RRGKTGMVELPTYVRRVLKGERAFYYFTKHRGTVAEWPSIALPDPFDPDFNARKAICDALERNDGALVLGGAVLPEPKSPEFWQAAEKAAKEAKRKAIGGEKTFTALIAAFKGHEQYQTLAASTQRGYDHYAELIEACWGDDLTADL